MDIRQFVKWIKQNWRRKPLQSWMSLSVMVMRFSRALEAETGVTAILIRRPSTTPLWQPDISRAVTWSWTVRFTNSTGRVDFRCYTNGWSGNQYVNNYQPFGARKVLRVSGIGSMLSKIGKALGWINISVEFCFWNIWHTILYSLFFGIRWSD